LSWLSLVLFLVSLVHVLATVLLLPTVPFLSWLSLVLATVLLLLLLRHVQMYNQALDGVYVPAAEVAALTDQDVVTALTIVAKNQVTTAVSGGRHSYIAQSTSSGGLVLSMANLTDMGVDALAADGTATVVAGAGVKMLQLYSFLARQTPALAFPGGSCPTVGLSGYLSGGGHGVTSPLLGVAADAVLAADVVVQNPATGVFSVVHANSTNEYADVLAALRGGMGGNYGVVTRWYLRATPVSTVMLFSFRADASGSMDDVTSKVLGYMAFVRQPQQAPGMPLPGNAVWGSVKFLSGSQLQFLGQCVCLGAAGEECDACASALEYLHAKVLGSPECDGALDAVGGGGGGGGGDGDDGDGWLTACSIVQQSYGEAQWSMAGCTDWAGADVFPPSGLKNASAAELDAAIAACVVYDRASQAGPYLGRSLFMPSEDVLDKGAIAAAAALANACNTSHCALAFDVYSGAMLQEPVGCRAGSPARPLRCTAFDHRSPSWHLQVLAFWTQPSDATAAAAWSQRAVTALRPMSLNTSYQNYLDMSLATQWPAMYFPAAGTFQELQRVKCAYNAGNVLAVQHAASMMVPLPPSCAAPPAPRDV
jgi:hypothetical protein